MFSFCVVMQPTNHTQKLWNGLRKNWTNLIMSSNESNSAFYELRQPALAMIDTFEEIFDDDSVFQNFKHPFSAFLKTIQMLSGDYAVDPYTLGESSKKLLFFLFIITSFILFNLINGLAISDIAMLKLEAEYLTLRQQIQNVAETESVISNIYDKICGSKKKPKLGDCDDEKEIEDVIKTSWYQKFACYFVSLLVRQYPYLHKMDNLCIDFKMKKVMYEQDDRRFHILQKRCESVVELYRPKHVMIKALEEIIIKNQLNESNLNEKVEVLQQEIKLLKTKMKHQHEELKKLLQNSLKISNENL
jgi:hypothetical protein